MSLYLQLPRSSSTPRRPRHAPASGLTAQYAGEQTERAVERRQETKRLADQIATAYPLRRRAR